MVEAGSTSEMSVNLYQTTQQNNLEDGHLHIHCHEKQQSFEFHHQTVMILYCVCLKGTHPTPPVATTLRVVSQWTAVRSEVA